jgi:glycogen debranching enzyme
MHGLISLRPREGSCHISSSTTILASACDGLVRENTTDGLFVHQTRLISKLAYLIDNTPFTGAGAGSQRLDSWLGYYIARSPQISASVSPAEKPIALQIRRRVNGGLREEIELCNYSGRQSVFTFEVALGGDFADLSAVASGQRKQHGELKTSWQGNPAYKLDFEYEAEREYQCQNEHGMAHFHRAMELRVEAADSEPKYRDGSICFQVSLRPQQKWKALLSFIPGFFPDESTGAGPFADMPRGEEGTTQPRSAMVLGESSGEALGYTVKAAFSRACADLWDLRLRNLPADSPGWTAAAGLPTYLAYFGRDTLVAARQAILFDASLLRGSLEVLARWQSKEVNEWRDAQPGRMLHQAEIGPDAVLNVNPFRRYYGTITTPALFPASLAQLWRWTGDRTVLARLIDPALRALDWLDHDARRGGDGFYYYDRMSEAGAKNQGWKDSGEAVIYEDGSQVEDPIAICDAQGYVYESKLATSHILWSLGRKREAHKILADAHDLKQRFNRRFWLEDAGFFAMGLDRTGRPIRSVASNPLHCLNTGIIEDELVARTIDRLFKDDLWSGWGVRTLSTAHPAYNPFSYQRGAVWPFEQGSLAAGLWRYGYYDRLEQLVKSQFEMAALFDHCRPPEVFGGQPRDGDHPFPGLYPDANWPQLWSSASLICQIQHLLGLNPYAPLGALLVDPHLPAWLPEVTLEDVSIGGATLSINFRRQGDGRTSYEVRKLRGRLRIVRQPSIDSVTAGPLTRAKSLLGSLMPIG